MKTDPSIVAPSPRALLRPYALFGSMRYAPDADLKGDKGDDKPEPKDKKKGEKEPAAPVATLTEDEAQQRIDAAIEAERKKTAKDRQKEKDDADRAVAEKNGEFEKLAEKEKADREAADKRAADAERRAQLAEVNVSLRDHLAAKHPEYLANAADIMLHVKDKLAADAKPADVKKLIEAEATAFVERTPRGRVVPPSAPPSSRPAPTGAAPKNNEDGRRGFTGASRAF